MERIRQKRSPNYTAGEKEKLLSLVKKYKNIIDCKRTGAIYIQRKKEAWMAITKQYNRICTTGPRDENMLKHFYNNIKHRARKVVASENKQNYLSDRNDEENSIENKNIKKTDEESCDPILTDGDHQILAVMDDHIRSDENQYDEAAEYIGDIIELPVEDQPTIIEEEPPNQIQKDEAFNIVKKKSKLQTELENKSVDSLRKIYLKKKIELVYHQKKNEMQKFRNEKIRHELQMKIMKQQLEKAEKDNKTFHAYDQ